MTLWYDQGRYTFQNVDSLRICDDARPPARWYVKLKYKTAYLGSGFVIVQLLALIKKDGADAVSTRIRMDRSLLTRFVRRYQSYVPRNLDQLLRTVNALDHGFTATFERSGVENVAGWRCNVYHSRTNHNYTLWVEPSSGYVLREANIYPSDNPRVPPSRSETSVVQFRILPSVEATHFQVPNGFTVILPRLLADIALPTGVKRQLMTGDTAMLGFDLKKLLQEEEQNERQINRGRKAKKR
jgi:hypothetical protein